MKNQTRCTPRADETLRSLNTQQMLHAGMSREKQNYDFIVQYPPPLTLRPMDGNGLYT